MPKPRGMPQVSLQFWLPRAGCRGWADIPDAPDAPDAPEAPDTPDDPDDPEGWRGWQRLCRCFTVNCKQ